MASNPNLYDNERTGDDLLARIDELTEGVGGPGHGWRYLLLACAREIRRLNATVQAGDTAISQLSQGNEHLQLELDGVGERITAARIAERDLVIKQMRNTAVNCGSGVSCSVSYWFKTSEE